VTSPDPSGWRNVAAGSARSGDADAAREQQARLEQLRDATGPAYWAEQVDIQVDVVGALALCADGQTADCIAALRQAAAREDATEKHVVAPGPILPAREVLADITAREQPAGRGARRIRGRARQGAEPLPGDRRCHASCRAGRRS
jgi:hypothetical protein